MSAVVQSVISSGTGGIIVDIECHLSNNLPTIVIVGFANQAVGESKERIRGAFADSRIILPRKRVTINLAPADVPKADSSFDLAIAVSILVASEQVKLAFTRAEAFIGELGLDGSVRPVRGVIGKILTGREHGISTFYVPAANLSQAQLVPNVTIMPVHSLSELYQCLRGETTITPVETGDGLYQQSAMSHNVDSSYFVQVGDVVGQLQAKRALEIAAAGGHNVFFSGPPGTGKSMLAKALASLMPPLAREEMLEVTQLHSLAGHDYERIIVDRPFRAPHHSASSAAIIGGGMTAIRPGEISLSHRGVLFFDELPEFGHTTLEALRQPLEDRIISIARARDSVEFPADFILVATANPCPCGYYGTTGDRCSCKAYDLRRYSQRISGPIFDRIDLYSDVHEVQHTRLLSDSDTAAEDAARKARVAAARALQAERYGSPQKLNAIMTNADVRRHAHISRDATQTLNLAARSANISARAYMRAVKVARTIADLDGSAIITRDHVSEALTYRRPLPANNFGDR